MKITTKWQCKVNGNVQNENKKIKNITDREQHHGLKQMYWYFLVNSLECNLSIHTCISFKKKKSLLNTE